MARLLFAPQDGNGCWWYCDNCGALLNAQPGFTVSTDILLLEIKNTTDAIVGASTTNIDINGLRVCDSTWSYDSINPGKTAIVDIDLSAVLEPEYLEVYGIKEVGHVDLDVNFKDTGSNEIVPAAHLSVTIPGADQK